jgi:glycosidase
MATELEILQASPIASLICAILGSMRYGCRLSFLRRWQTSAMTFLNTVTSIQRSARFPILTISSRLPTMSESKSSSTSCPTIPPISIPGSSKAGDRASIPSATGTSWRDPKPDGSPPNNWLSEFGGPAWTFDHRSGQYYYHAYLKQQPDLNWRNPDVREAMFDVLRFWLDRGVDGFRVDAIHHLYEDQEGADNPPNPTWREGMSPARRLLRKYTMDQPETHEAIRDMRRVIDRYSERVLIGEAYLPIEILMTYYGSRLDGFHLPFNFHLMSTPWKPNDIAALIQAYESALPAGAWPNWVLGNHDRSRLASRIGSAQARVAAMLLLTLRGTPTIYQGEEIAMTDVPIPQDRVRDPWEKNVPRARPRSRPHPDALGWRHERGLFR